MQSAKWKTSSLHFALYTVYFALARTRGPFPPSPHDSSPATRPPPPVPAPEKKLPGTYVRPPRRNSRGQQGLRRMLASDFVYSPQKASLTRPGFWISLAG